MGRYVYERVVLIGVDGAGTFFENANTPNLDMIFREGAVSQKVLAAFPTLSAECWATMLLGVAPECHGISGSVIWKKHYDEKSVFPSVFRVIHEKEPEAVLASFCNYSAINSGIVEENLGVYKVNGKDTEITQRVCEYVAENDPKFLFVQFDEVDTTGHRFDYGSEEYFAQISITDGYIRQIYDAYQDRGFLENTLFIVTADHGGLDYKHGGSSVQEKYVMCAVCGKTVVNGTIGDMEIGDCAAIVLYALGLEQPKTWTARVPSGLFERVAAGARPLKNL